MNVLIFEGPTLLHWSELRSQVGLEILQQPKFGAERKHALGAQRQTKAKRGETTNAISNCQYTGSAISGNQCLKTFHRRLEIVPQADDAASVPDALEIPAVNDADSCFSQYPVQERKRHPEPVIGSTEHDQNGIGAWNGHLQKSTKRHQPAFSLIEACGGGTKG